MSTIYVSPLGSGDGSGSSVGNAMPFGQLNAAIQAAGAGGTVLLLADQGIYQTIAPVQISSGGTDAAPVTIRGADSAGNAMDVQISGTRAPVYTAGMTEVGNDVFVLVAGANNLIFDGFDFANVGAAFHLSADLRNLTIQNMEGDNVRLFVGHYLSESFASATVTGLTVRDVEIHGFSAGVVWLQYDSSKIVIERVYGDSEYQDKDRAGFAEGIHLDGTVHDVLIKDTTMMNCVRSTSDYWNGDGFATERDVYDVRFENTVARGNADGGYDLKSTGTVLVNAVAEDNARNFRLWGEIQLINPTGIDPHKHGGSGGQYQVQILNNAQVTVAGGWFVDSGSNTKVVHSDGTGTIGFSDTHVFYAGTLTAGSGISGIDPALVARVAPTGTYSTDGEIYIGADPPPAPDPGQTLTGTTGNDTLQATSDAKWTVEGLAGNDTITTLGGNDVITGGVGNDTISSGPGDDLILFGGTGQGFDSIAGGTGADRIEALSKKTVIGLASISGIEAISANGYASVSISGSKAADTLDFSAVALAGITAINAGGGNDTISGSAAADVIAGGAGVDLLRGNGGADVFDYNATSDSRGTARDTILDFQPGSDKLDLKTIDAVGGVSGNQTFTFIGEVAFGHKAGELRIDATDPNKTIVLGDINGDGAADFAVELSGSLDLTAADFIL